MTESFRAPSRFVPVVGFSLFGVSGPIYLSSFLLGYDSMVLTLLVGVALTAVGPFVAVRMARSGVHVDSEQVEYLGMLRDRQFAMRDIERAQRAVSSPTLMMVAPALVLKGSPAKTVVLGECSSLRWARNGAAMRAVAAINRHLGVAERDGAI